MADIDGDGTAELLSGSFSGEISVFRSWREKEPKGTFLPGPDGKAYDLGDATSVALGDWDGDGDPDLVVGQMVGPVLFLRNDKGTFVEPRPLKAGNQVIEAVDGGPHLADWDGDGDLDLLVGEESGRIRLFTAGGKGSPPTLAPAGDLLQPAPEDTILANRMVKDYNTMALGREWPGYRTKPYVTDWNGDGKPDLLVGDVMLLEPDVSSLPADKRQRLAEIEKESSALAKTIAAEEDKFDAQARKELKLPPTGELSDADMVRLMERVAELSANEAFVTMTTRMTEFLTEIVEIKGYPKYAGWVWVFLRK